MAKATLNIQHDYITLRVTFADGSKFNFTKSYGGAKVSGNHATRESLMFFDAWTKEGGGTMGEKMQRLCERAKTASTMQEFIKAA